MDGRWAHTVNAAENAPTVSLPRRPAALLASMPLAARLTSIVVISILIRMLVALTSPAPWIIPDEIVYSELASGFASTGHFMVRDAPFAAWTYGPLYPILLAPAYLVGAGAAGVFMIVKVINAVLLSASAVPAPMRTAS